MKDLRFSQWCCRKFSSSRMWSSINGFVAHAVSKGHSSFIFRVKQYKSTERKALSSFKKLGTINPVIQHHLPEVNIQCQPLHLLSCWYAETCTSIGGWTGLQHFGKYTSPGHSDWYRTSPVSVWGLHRECPDINQTFNTHHRYHSTLELWIPAAWVLLIVYSLKGSFNTANASAAVMPKILCKKCSTSTVVTCSSLTMV